VQLLNKYETIINFVTPAKVGIQLKTLQILDPRIQKNDFIKYLCDNTQHN